MNFWEYLSRRASRRDALMRAPKTRRPPTGFWGRLMSAQTARFILTLLALIVSTATTFYVTSKYVSLDLKDVAVFALGQMFALTSGAYGYYFGSTARRDEGAVDAHITNSPKDPVPTAPQQEDPAGG